MRERRAFADSLEEIGPDAPTLAGSWRAHDLAAHVVSLDRFAGVPTFLGRTVVARFGLRLNDLAGEFADAALRSARRKGFAWAVARLRADPPGALLRPSIAALGLAEIFVHHQDVRRANDLPVHRAPAELETAIPLLLRYQRRRLPVTVAVDLEDGASTRSGGADDQRVVRLRGDVGEVVLWLAGRRDVASVNLDGDAAAVAALKSARVDI